MGNLILFSKTLMQKVKKNELFLMSNALTYKLIVAIFPFIIFIMTLLGLFDIQVSSIIENFIEGFPKEIASIFNLFLQEVIYTKNISLLSSSFLISIYSSSTGFYSIIQVLNRAYEKEETRSFLKVRFISFMLVFIFAIIISFSLVLFVFGDVIKNFLFKYAILKNILFLFDSLFFYAFIGIVLLCVTLITYKIAINKKLVLVEILPGAIFTVVCWMLLSKVFNIYINNFSKYSKIYGSIGGIFALFLWLNMISFVFLIGGQVNAILVNKTKSKLTQAK